MQTDTVQYFILEHTRILSMGRPQYDLQTHHKEYLKPSTVVDEFSYVTDQVIQLLQGHDPKLLVEQCKSIMASDTHGIDFFTDDQVKKFKEYNSTAFLLQELSFLWSWSNHTVLRVLVGFCDEAIKLLDEFDCRLDPLVPMTSYPCHEITSVDSTTQSVLEMICNDSDELSLQSALDMCSLVINMCDVTQHCLQLLATQSSFTIYLSVPKRVVHLIGTKVLQHCNLFYKQGVLEVGIHPDLWIDTGKLAHLNVS